MAPGDVLEGRQRSPGEGGGEMVASARQLSPVEAKLSVV
ncbi:hypothetical protein A2U01_0105584 [Trifolium medium]|uniref:Uncharacterized protein n=1 Tax=Trifolium medium TaxID=97028 RepID=A0A392V7X2_9FABA|nr:hypothetical protein [Trifolium medium]